MTSEPESPPSPNPANPGQAEPDNAAYDESYDPFTERDMTKSTTDAETFGHIVKSVLGTGILALPKAYYHVGLVYGVFGTVLFGVTTTYCLHLLISATHINCKIKRVPLMTYQDSFKTTCHLGPNFMKKVEPASRCLVDTFILIYQEGICIVYTIFVASNIKSMLDGVIAPISLRMYILMLLPPLLVLSCIRSLKNMAPLSHLANLLIVFALVVIIVYAIITPPLTEELDYAKNEFFSLALFTGTIMFAYTSIGMIMSLENAMAKPQNFLKPLGVLNKSMATVIFLYVLVGAIGYSYCRRQCRDSITLDMPQNMIGLGVQLPMSIAILISYMLNFYAIVEIVYYYAKPRILARNPSADAKALLKWEYIIRIILCLISVFTAFCVPRLGDVISLLGALCVSAIGFLFPFLMYLCVLYMKKKLDTKRKIWIAFLCFVALIAFASGTFVSLLSIVKSYF